jgi:Paf1
MIQNSSDDSDVDEIDKDMSFKIHVDHPYFEPIQLYDLDVIPLKDEDTPHSTFALVLDSDAKVVKYIPLASRVSLSTGRPPYKTKNVSSVRLVKRRPLTSEEEAAIEEQISEMDIDLAEKYGSTARRKLKENDNDRDSSFLVTKKTATNNDFDDGESDENAVGDDESDDDDEIFGGGTKTIVAAES